MTEHPLTPGGARVSGRMRGICRAAFLLLFWVATIVPAAARPDTPTPAAQPAPVTVDELERLVDTLQDDTARAKLVAELRALIAAQRGGVPEKPAATAIFGQLS